MEGCSSFRFHLVKEVVFFNYQCVFGVVVAMLKIKLRMVLCCIYALEWFRSGQRVVVTRVRIRFIQDGVTQGGSRSFFLTSRV